MKQIGINLGAYGKKLSVEEEVSLLSHIGFTHAFLISEDERIDEYAKAINHANITLANLHAPFSRINDIWLPMGDERGEDMLNRLLRAVDCCRKYGTGVLVVHLSSGENAPRICDAGIERYDRLMAYAKENGIKIAYENQRKLASLSFALETYSDAGFCWDTGHEACFTAFYRHAPMFGSRMIALHLHSNLCEYNGDLHLLPFDGKIDMERVAKELSLSAYRGPVLLEVARHNSHLYDTLSAEEYYERAYLEGVRFAELFEKYQAQNAR